MATLLPVLAWKSETILSIVSLMGFGDSRVISLWARAPSEMPSTTAMSATNERMDFMVRPLFGFNEPGQPSLCHGSPHPHPICPVSLVAAGKIWSCGPYYGHCARTRVKQQGRKSGLGDGPWRQPAAGAAGPSARRCE